MRRATCAALLCCLAASGCDCESRARKLVSQSSEERKAARTEIGPALQQLTEVEPNDSPREATPIVLSGEFRPVHGEVASAQDVDWYALAHDESQTVAVELIVEPVVEAGAAPLDVALYVEVSGAEDVAPLLYDLGGAGEAESVPVLGVEAVQPLRFFVAGAGGTTGKYTVQVRRRLSGGAVAAEPNDHPQVAVGLEVPGEIQGFYDRPHDRDVFFVAAEALRRGEGGQAAIFSIELGHVPNLSQRLQIFGDARLEHPLLTLPVGPRQSASLPNVSLPEASTGLWFVLTAGERYDREQPYRLRILAHPPEADVTIEREPNDTEHTAQPVAIGERVRGYVHDASDIDRFRIAIAAPEPAEWGADALPGVEGPAGGERSGDERLDGGAVDDPFGDAPPVVDPFAAVPEKTAPEHVLQVRLEPLNAHQPLGMRWLPPPGGREVASELVPSRPEQPLVFCNHVPAPGAYDVEVRALEVGERPANRGFDYELSVSDIAKTEGLEIEPNDSPEAADRLESGKTAVGYITHAGDVDVFAFVVPARERAAEGGEANVPGSEPGGVAGGAPGQEPSAAPDPYAAPDPFAAPDPYAEPELRRVVIALEGNALNLEFSLLDDEHGRVADVNRAGPGGNEQLEMQLPTGLYFVRVSAGRGFNCEPYRLSVRVGE